MLNVKPVGAVGFKRIRSQKRCKLNLPVFEINYIRTILHSFKMLHIKTALKEKNVRFLMAFFRRTFWINKS